VKSALVFGSGGGSNFKSIYKHIETGELALNISCVISNNSTSGILHFASEKGLNTFHLSQKKLPDAKEYEHAYLNLLDTYSPDLVILAGYMKHIPASFIQRMPFKILNIHPSLLPAFGGHGMYGLNVHKAVFQRGTKISGATIHFVTEDYDEGPILLQEQVLLNGDESPEEIAEKVLQVEHTLYPKAVKICIDGDYIIKENRVVLLERENK